MSANQLKSDDFIRKFLLSLDMQRIQLPMPDMVEPRSREDADKRIRAAIQLFGTELLRPQHFNLEQRLVLDSTNAYIRASAVQDCLANASEPVQCRLVSALANHETRFLLCVMLYEAGTYSLLRCACLQAKRCQSKREERAVLLRERALVCTGARWRGTQRLLQRARRCEGYTDDGHASRILKIFEAIELDLHDARATLGDICNRIIESPGTSASAAAASTEALVAAVLCELALKALRSGKPKNDSLACKEHCSNKKEVEGFLDLETDGTLDQAENIIKCHGSFKSSHPLWWLCKAAREFVYDDTKRRRVTSARNHARMNFRLLWTHAHKRAVQSIYNYVKMEPDAPHIFAEIRSQVDRDRGSDGSDGVDTQTGSEQTVVINRQHASDQDSVEA